MFAPLVSSMEGFMANLFQSGLTEKRWVSRMDRSELTSRPRQFLFVSVPGRGHGSLGQGRDLILELLKVGAQR